MPPALWLIVIPLGAAPIVYLFRRTWLGAVVAAGVAGFSAWLALKLPLGLVLNILGRPVELNRLSQITLALLFGIAAILFLIASPLTTFNKRQNAIATDTGRGRTFHTVGLVTLAIFVAASLSRHLGITALLMEIGVVFTVFIIQGRRLASTRAAQRFLILITLALPLFLLAAWRIDQYQLSSGNQSDSYLQQTVLLVGIGFALWLAVWPFHSWQSTTAADASPPAAAFVLALFPIVIFSILLNLLNATPWLITASSLAWTMIIAGGTTTVVTGLLAAVQRGFRPLLGYAALSDVGLLLMVLGIGGKSAVLTILVGLTVRALALALLTAGMLALQLYAADDGFAQITGLARQLPVATAGIILGGLSLAGVPLTIGFPLRWHLLHAGTDLDARWPVLLVLAGLGVSLGYLRGLNALFSTKKEAPASNKDAPQRILSMQEPRLLLLLITLLAITCLVLSLFPSLLIEPLQQLALGVPVPVG